MVCKIFQINKYRNLRNLYPYRTVITVRFIIISIIKKLFAQKMYKIKQKLMIG